MSHTIHTALNQGIERISFIPTERRHQTPLLFIHGMWHGAWCWEGWQAQLADLGWESHAISLPGHAGSPVQRSLRWCTLQYYLGFVKREVDRLGRKPVLLGHSMGGALTQHYLKSVGDDLPAAVLVAPWPYTNYPWGPLLFLRLDPAGSVLGALKLSAETYIRSPKNAAKLLLGPNSAVTPEWLHQRLNGESFIVMNQHMWPLWHAPKQMKTPTMLLAGELDAVVPLAWEARTARRYGSELVVIPGAGHNLMHEKSSADTVRKIDSWLSAGVE